MTRIVPKDLPTHIAEVFGLAPTSARQYGGGHINDTYRIETSDRPYILQRINDSVFTRPVELMENVGRVTRHVRGRLEAEGVDEVDRRLSGRRIESADPAHASHSAFRDRRGRLVPSRAAVAGRDMGPFRGAPEAAARRL